MALSMAKLLLEKRRQLEEQARALLDHAEGEKRGLSAEEEVQFNKIGEDMNSLRKQADSIVQFAADTEAANEALRGFGNEKNEKREEDKGNELLTNLRSVLRGETRSLEYKATPEELRGMTEYRALAKGTNTAGGYTVPISFYGKLVEHMIQTASLLRGGATILNTSSGEQLQIPITTSHGTAALVAEAGTIPQADPVFGQRALGAYKYGDLIRVPRELIDDTDVDLLGYLARQAGRAVGNALGADLITGNGTGKPLGLFASTTLGVTGATGVVGVPNFDNLIDLYYSVIPPYRNSPEAAWLINDTTAGAIRKLKDGQGRYLWEPSLVPGTPDTILGKAVHTDPNVAATAVNAKSVAFGDLSQYYVRLVNGIRFERSDDFAFDADVVVFRCLVRGDGILVDQTGAVKHFVGAAT